MHIIYLLQLNNKQIYTGFTTNLKQRLCDHNSGKVESTKNRRPIKLIHYECYLIKSDAIRREKYLKTSDGKRFLKQQLSDYFKKLHNKNITTVRP